MFLNKMIPLVSSFVSSPLWIPFFIPIIALAFLATVPKIIRYLIGLGGR